MSASGRGPAIDGIVARWLRLSPNVRGAIWILLAALLFSSMGALVKTLGARLDSFEIAFFRCLFGLFAVLPFLGREGLAGVKTKRLSGHFLRAVLGVGAMFSGFYAVTHLPLANAAAISFTKPLFMILLAVVLLHETVRMRRWIATGIGFAGVLMMVRPGPDGFEFAAFVALFGALLVSAVQITVKSLAVTERPVTILVWFGVFSTLAALGPAILVWKTPTLVELGMLLAVGALGASGQSLTIRGLRVAEAAAIAPFDYARLLFSAGYGFLLFSEVPTIWTVVGALVIVFSTLYIARREALMRARAAALAKVGNDDQGDAERKHHHDRQHPPEHLVP